MAAPALQTIMSDIMTGLSLQDIKDPLLKLPYSWLAKPDSKDRTCRALTLHLPRTRESAEDEQLPTTNAKNEELLYTPKPKGVLADRLQVLLQHLKAHCFRTTNYAMHNDKDEMEDA